ncbi:FecR family protein [Stenotrophomonas mori]|uniref:FecR domain-containing protein n=1 Tax=Stenotrophomonas mori TaxID=2871096 RepID=A0ABT0SD70_9GAMM|nr:FecR domain-containing protein [Stenotrophomonas mori]MCL7713247.1 FecR domain-containing protein [Stenotrophomonas mori]
MTGTDRAGLAAWLAESRLNRGAYLRAQAALLALETAVRSAPAAISGNDAEYGAAPAQVRGRRARHAALAAALALVATLGLLLFLLPHQGAGPAQRQLTLQDGSRVMLQDDARIHVALDGQARRVTLLSGRATFHVAKDRTRPFVVNAGQVSAQATGTVYSVTREGPAGGTVEVDEGSVLVWAGNERDQAVLLRAGGRLTLEPGPGGPVSPGPGRAQISLDNASISEAVARFNRINRTQIVIADPAIGQVGIVGLFHADDPEQFAQAAAAVAGGKVVKHDGMLVLQAR